MKKLYRSWMIVFLVFTFLFYACLIPANTHARVWIAREVNFGEPGESPILSPIIKTSNSPEATLTASSTRNNPMETKCISVWELYSKILFGQFISFIF